MISAGKVRLRPKRPEDAESDYAWQSDAELTRLDAAIRLSMPFDRYLVDYATVLSFPSTNRRQFAVEALNGRHIGNCAYYNINEAGGEAEVGIMIGDSDYWDKGCGTDAITALVDHIFRSTKLKRLYLKTLDTNIRAQRCFQKSGFTPCGSRLSDGNSFVLMEQYRHQWQRRFACRGTAASKKIAPACPARPQRFRRSHRIR
jgi:RimJ/RimL family protein N-acetyltransferase